jgi:hypothetical protein
MNFNLRRSDRIKNMQAQKNESDIYLEQDDRNTNESNAIMNDNSNNEKTNKLNNNQDESNEDKDKFKNSAIEKHRKETNHKINWENAQLIWTDSNPHKLLIKESLIIKAFEPELNRTTHSVPLYIYPNGICKQFLPRLNL